MNRLEHPGGQSPHRKGRRRPRCGRRGGLASLPLWLLAACASVPGSSDWERRVVLSTGVKLGGCAIGDLDPARPGDEIAAVAENGDVWVAWREDGRWHGQAVANVGGEMIQCAIGDLDLDSEGLEIVVVGMVEGPENPAGPGRAHVLRRSGASWTAEPVFEDAALLHAVAVGRGEAYVAGYSNRAFRVVRGQSGWRSDPIAPLPGAAKSAVAARDGIAFACTDGSVVVVRRDGAGWTNDVVHRRDGARARLGSDGERFVVADDDGTVTLVEADGSAERVHRARQKARGAVLADLEPAIPGLEVATVGYDRQVVVAHWQDSAWHAVVLFEEDGRLHHAAAGDVDPAPGVELVAVGFAGDVVLYRRAR